MTGLNGSSTSIVITFQKACKRKNEFLSFNMSGPSEDKINQKNIQKIFYFC